MVLDPIALPLTSRLTPPNLKYNFLYYSDAPQVALDEPCVLGIDEAGRGPVLGPMVYGACYYPLSFEEEFKKLNFDDSKKLSKEKRETLFRLFETYKDKVGWIIHSLSPQFISTCMLRKNKYNLNDLAHDTTVGMIQKLVDLGVAIEHVYVDTVGPPKSYEQWLTKQFSTIKFRVAKRADSLYSCVSGASICAKVIRDSILENWEESLDLAISERLGSGYPADPLTKEWLAKSVDPVFGYYPVVRFSWSTIDDLLIKQGIKINWPESEALLGVQKLKSSSNVTFNSLLTGIFDHFTVKGGFM
ncbi:ribonuclease-like protein H2 large subunit [Conidiobolus coronatus NRRL 28638]|uniref:Ribonuclease n=1 Tax=Conidiobolus coronatus (strain ATCC 28846 / CBS 209.66 / NRRL 28638) TaxID=796925 RepID=A0A137P130_CONC2|nr:ribonuclease-like protein H2 large subunit [Conidiobolus coronatus NRRL 28638]|eukprot:KXN68581.1 ribonuclease-like protein H2 large subunit [Conidiobolus coronatus NRRL 28638]